MTEPMPEAAHPTTTSEPGHAFVPSKRPDSCDFTDWQTWLVCDRPMAHHATPQAREQEK